MKQFFLRLAFVATTLVPATSVLAADIDVPPPDDLRPATFDWTGGYIGVFGSTYAVDGSFDGTCSCGATYSNLEHSGIGWGGGVLAGYNFQTDSMVFGIEGDWGLAGNVASNDEPTIDTSLSFSDIGTLRARLGFADDRTLFYVTGGAAAVDTKFSAQMASAESDKQWVWGWTAGAGIEHAFTDNFTARIEYLYLGLPDTDYTMTDSAGTTLTSTQSFKDAHMVRAALAYKF